MQTLATQALTVPRDIRELTSVRFFAAMWVVLLHFSFELNGGVGILAPFVERGDLGVDLFFILSGFILTHVYFRAFEQGRSSYGRYMLYRIGRIWPLHLFTLGLAVLGAIGAQLLAVKASQPLPWEDLPYHVLMIHAWGVTDRTVWNDPSWSISAEFFAYLATPAVFALALAFLRRPALMVLGAAIGFLAAYLATLAVAGKPLTMLNADFGIVRIAPEFVLGCALCRLDGAVTLSRWAASLCAWGALAAGVAALYLRLPDAMVVLAQAALIFALAQRAKHPAWNLMRSRPLVFLGEISYAIYLVHALVDRATFTVLGLVLDEREGLPLLPWLLAFPVLIISAAILYRMIELPGRALVRRWTDARFAGSSAKALPEKSAP